MYEVLTCKKTKTLENNAKKAGFSSIFFIDNDNTILIKTNNTNELIRKISSLSAKKKKIIVFGSTDEINRIAVDDKRVSMLLQPEAEKNKDFMHYRNSGLNHVLCKLSSANNTAIGFSYDAVKSTKSTKRADLLARMMQNTRLCRKYKTKIVLASFGKKISSPYALKSFGATIGMSTKQIKDSLEHAKSIFD